jgi:hypothetical protein
MEKQRTIEMLGKWKDDEAKMKAETQPFMK